GMTRAFARTTEGLAVWQVQLIADAMGRMAQRAETRLGQQDDAAGSSGGSDADSGPQSTRAVPDPATARAAAVKLADIADDLEPLLIYAWRRHLSAAITRLVTEGIGEGDEQRWAHG
ncbi:MAG: adenylate cyclase, partial [Actinomycetota bacterium]|nr:adenylate cyclase [Actinomycetota bacterium]